MPAPHPVSPDLLLRHSAALRALARGLLGDEHAAEDVVQETWLTALERPPQHDSRLGGWLRTVAQSLAMKRLRGEGRRNERERSAARGESLASTAEVFAERQVLRRVVDAVLALSEPYQTAVVLRYYEDLPPREIADRLGRPVATVRSQLHRGLAELRRKLDADDLERGEERGHWALALGTLTGWKLGAPVPPVSTGSAAASSNASPVSAGGATAGAPSAGISAMFTSLNLKLALGASSLALAAAWVVQPDPGTEPHALAPAPQDGAVASAEPGTRELVHASAAGQDRESVAAPAALAAAAPAALVASLPGDPAHTFVIEGVVVGGDDRPVGGAHVFLAPALHPFNLAVDTESDGSFRAVWKGRGPAMSVAVAVRSSQGWIGLDQVDVVAGRPLSLRLGVHNTGFVRRAVMVEQLVVNGKYQDVPIYANAQVRREVEAAAAKLKASLDLAAQKRYLSTDLAWEDPLAGVFRTDLAAKLGQQELLAAIAAVDDAELLERVRTLEVAEVARVGELKKRKALAELGLQFGSGEAPPAGPQTILTGLVLDELGQPVPRASVLVRTELESHSHLTRDDGTFRLERLPVETELTVEIGGGDDGLARAILSSPADGETFHYEAVLDRGLELAGVLRDEHGAPLAGWLVEDVVAAAPGAGPWYDSTVTGEDGSFAIPNLPDAAGELYLRPAADWHPIPQHVVHGARAGGAELELVVPAESLATGGLSLVVQGSAGRVLPEAEVRVWHADTGRGTWAVWNAEAGVFALDGLSAGRYRVEAGSRVDGWVDLGEVWIAAGERVELGTVHLPEPGTLHVAFELGPEPDAASLTWSLSHLRDDVESALETTSLESALEGPIAPGEYLVRVAGEDFGTHVLALEVRSGETTEATLSLADARPALLRFVPADGASFGEEPVRYVLQDPETARPVLQQVLEPDADGNATTRVFLVSGSYRLTAGASGGALGAGTAIEVGTGPVEVVLE